MAYVGILASRNETWWVQWSRWHFFGTSVIRLLYSDGCYMWIIIPYWHKVPACKGLEEMWHHASWHLELLHSDTLYIRCFVIDIVDGFFFILPLKRIGSLGYLWQLFLEASYLSSLRENPKKKESRCPFILLSNIYYSCCSSFSQPCHDKNSSGYSKRHAVQFHP